MFGMISVSQTYRNVAYVSHLAIRVGPNSDKCLGRGFLFKVEAFSRKFCNSFFYSVTTENTAMMSNVNP
jgi:hypothetical protein